MKKFLAILVLSLFFSNLLLSKERSEKEIKIGVFLEDLKDIGKFKKIEKIPEELFPKNLKTFFPRAQKAQQEVSKIFIQQKGLLDKYPERMMLGMAYFEFFYMQTLRDNEKNLKTFANKYPTNMEKSSAQKLYNLNIARKTMREALGLSITDSPEIAVEVFYTMSKLFSQNSTKEIKLSKDEKKKIKLHKEIDKNLAKAKKTIEKFQEQRLTKKKFNKESEKNFKKLVKSIQKAEMYKEYELLSSLITELPQITNNNLSAGLSGYRLADFIMKDLKKNHIPKKYEQDLSGADLSNFKENELKILGNVTVFAKKNRNRKSNEIQIDILNLEDNGLPVNKLLDVYRKDLNVKLDSINMQLSSTDKMAKWALSDWANAWKSPIPTKVQDISGVEVVLSNDQIQEIKAQLAIQNFREIINIEDFKDVIQSDTFNDITQTVSQVSQSFNFNFTLDDFARALGDFKNLDISNYADLTDLANAQYGSNWSVEEYASAYQGNLDAIEALASGSISSFDAGALAQAAGETLQSVADTIAAASAAGVSVDLEAVAAGAGYDSFAAAVDAYNAEHGTSYTVDQARDALGQ
jgi:hypothetical protein